MQKFSNGNLIHHSHSRVVQNKKSQGIVREGEKIEVVDLLVAYLHEKIEQRINQTKQMVLTGSLTCTKLVTYMR